MENDNLDDQYEKYIIDERYRLLSGRKAGLSTTTFQYVPIAHIPILSNEDIARGMIFRYFTRKSNNINATATEISRDEYENKAKPSPFYICTYIRWMVKGPLYDEFDEDGILQYKGVIAFNENQIKLAMDGAKIKIGIKNPLEFYKKD